MSGLKRDVSISSEMNDMVDGPDGKKVYNVSGSRLMRLINWFYVFKVYLPIVTTLLIVVLISQIVRLLFHHGFNFNSFVAKEINIDLNSPFVFDLGWKTVLLIFLILFYISRKDTPIYLMDYATFKAPDDWKVSQERIIKCISDIGCFNEESIAFMDRMVKQSGVNGLTAWPPGMTKVLKGEPQDKSFAASREEAKVIMFDVVNNVLKKTGLKPKDIDILIVNCSLFSPTPSLCTMIINEFNFKSNVISYNLSGMGCSAGVVAVELAKNILSSHPNSRALVVSTEIITPNLYYGDERSFLLQNILFRCGGSGVILSNMWRDGFSAKLKLLHIVRTQLINEDSHGCVYEEEDSNGIRGVRLSKDLVKVAGRAMEKNLTTLGPHVLPLSEQLKVVNSMVGNMVIKFLNSTFKLKLDKIKPYIPNFTRGIEHFCIHAGGRGVIDGIEKNLNLSPRHVEASRHTLHNFGNTSSSSIWYEMEYVTENMDLSRGQRVLQLAFGSGFKCNTAVWLCLNNNSKRNNKNKSD